MRTIIIVLLLPVLFVSCNTSITDDESLQGTWQLISGTIVEKNDTTFTDYTKDRKMIKILNASHFSFLNHDLAKDSASFFIAGGGRYTLEGDKYTEHLEYCSDRAWEGHNFSFTVKIQNDTLVQTGIEKIEDIGVDRLNIEKYVRIRE